MFPDLQPASKNYPWVAKVTSGVSAENAWMFSIFQLTKAGCGIWKSSSFAPGRINSLWCMLQSPWSSGADAETSTRLVPCTMDPRSSGADAETFTCLVPCTEEPLEFRCWCWDLYRLVPPVLPPQVPYCCRKKHISHKSLIPAPTSQQQFLENPSLNLFALKKKIHL